MDGMEQKIVTVDIGNTSVVLCVMEEDCVVKTFQILNQQSGWDDHFQNMLLEIFSCDTNMNVVMICSVVPEMLKKVKMALQRQSRVFSIFIAGQDIKIPMDNLYTDPKQVGHDRLVGAYAARALYGTPLIVIDMGTAITLDVVNKSGAYEGGIIAPGMLMSADSLFKKTALLPSLDKITMPDHLVGKDTQGSILSGLFYGYGMMIAGLINLIQNQYESEGKFSVVLTGGYAELMQSFLGDHIKAIDMHLVHKGLVLLTKT